MMRAADMSSAALLAASEILPGEWRDLSEALEGAGNAEWLVRHTASEGADTPLAVLRTWVQQNVDLGRVEYWSKQLDRLAHQEPTVTMLTVLDKKYPALLRHCWDRPPFIFCDGDLHNADALAVAIVGSRQAPPSALEAAWEVAASAAKRGITVVSGLARGVDTAAHIGALESGGRTIAVLGCAIDMEPRRAQGGLVDDIRAQGAIVSQFRPGSPATRSTFPMRNAVISGLGVVSLLIDAGEASGTRSEADHALRQGRKVLLWSPVLGDAPWAREFARDPGVEFVDDIAHVHEVLDQSVKALGLVA